MKKQLNLIFNRKNNIILFSLCAILMILLLVAYQYNILFFCLRYKLPSTTRIKIIEYLAESETGVDIAINDLLKGSPASRFGAFFILLWSNNERTTAKLDSIVKEEISETNIIQIMEALCILLEKTKGNEEYLNKLYELVKKADRYDNLPLWDFEKYYGRSIFLKYSDGKLSEEELSKLLTWPRDKDYPQEFDERFK